jgi:uncharacterized membrane protein
MATTTERSTPAHLWIVGLLALLWNAYGCYEYVMMETRNEAFLSGLPAEWVAYWESLPAWLTASWALGVWGGLAGAALLLIRSRYAVWAFALSFVGLVVDLGYQMFMTEMPAGMLDMLDWLIIAIAAFLLWYAWSMEKKGALR